MLQIERQRKVEEEKETSFRYKGVEVSKVKLDRYRKGAPPADSIKSTTCKNKPYIRKVSVVLIQTSCLLRFILLYPTEFLLTETGYVNPRTEQVGPESYRYV